MKTLIIIPFLFLSALALGQCDSAMARARTLYGSGEHVLALKIIDQELFKHPDDEEVVYLKASCHEALENWDIAIKWYSRHMEISVDRERSYVYRSNAYMNAQRYEEALSDLNTLLGKYNAKNQNTFTALAWTYYHLHKPDSSIKYFDLAIETSPKAGFLYCHRGHVLESFKMYEEACKSIEKCNSLGAQCKPLNKSTCLPK